MRASRGNLLGHLDLAAQVDDRVRRDGLPQPGKLLVLFIVHMVVEHLLNLAHALREAVLLRSQTLKLVYEERVRPAKTSAAAAFALVFGVSALLSVLTVIVGPLGIVLAIIGIILGIVGIRNARRVGVTGKGVATGGLVLSVIALLIAGLLAAGVTFFLNDDQAVNRLEQKVQQLRDQLPDNINVPQP